MWSDYVKKMAFIGIVCHYLSEKSLIERVLCVKRLKLKSQTGENIMIKIKEVFDEFELYRYDDYVFITDRGKHIIKALNNYT
jgi:hypothetical protein